MDDYIFTVVDARDVQSYIFGANELKQNLGASELVEQTTHDWIYETLEKLGKYNADDSPEKLNGQTIDDDLIAEVIYAGGGNTGLIFKSITVAMTFARQLTMKVLTKAPGLRISIAHVPIDNWSNAGAFLAAWKRMQTKEMPERKAGRITSLPLLGLGVTAECVYTGMPAVDAKNGQLIAEEVVAKRNARTYALGRMNDFFQDGNISHPESFERIGGEKGRAAYIAVVHIDGNNMGDRMTDYVEQGDPNNRAVIERLQKFSQSINKQGRVALQAARHAMVGVAKPDPNDPNQLVIPDIFNQELIPITNNEFPFWPIVFGGDDVTFVCDGRLGLILASKFLESLGAEPLADGRKCYACAGVAIIHTHFPFSRAYTLADHLCSWAKREVRANGCDRSMLNWHYGISGLLGSWEEILSKDYLISRREPLTGKIQSTKDNLTMRPVQVFPKVADFWRSWSAFTGLIKAFQDPKGEWARRRSKIKLAREELRAGTDAVKQFTERHGAFPALPGLDGIEKQGWYGDRCGYFDAIEAADLCMLLK